MTLLAPVSRDGITPEVERPAPEKVLAGDPVHTTWNVDTNGDICCGLWHATVGKWKVSYDEWEYVRILEGVSILTDAEGTAVTLRAGDSYVIRPGFAGTWEVIEPTLKDYVIR